MVEGQFIAKFLLFYHLNIFQICLFAVSRATLLINYLSFSPLDLCHSLLPGLSASFLSSYYQFPPENEYDKEVNKVTLCHCIKPSSWFHSFSVAKIQTNPCPRNLNLIILLPERQLRRSFLSSAGQARPSLPHPPLSRPYHPAYPRELAAVVPSAWKRFHILGLYAWPQKALLFVLCLKQTPLSSFLRLFLITRVSVWSLCLSCLSSTSSMKSVAKSF